MTSAADDELMDSVDLAWLEMDEPGNPMVVAGLMELEPSVSADALVERVVEGLLRYPRFSQIADDRRAPATWRFDPQMDWAYHVRVRKQPRSKAALREAVAAELGMELDRWRPLWRLTVFSRGEHATTVLFRAHHAVADGIALMQVLARGSDGGETRPHAAPPPHRAHGGPLGGVIDRLEFVNSALQGLSEAVAEDLRHPQRIAEQLRAARATLGTMRRLTSLRDDNPACLRAALSGRRAVAWMGALPFGELRQFARWHEVTLNDVLLCALAGAFAHYLEAVGAPVTATQNLRVSIPVNLRPQEDDGVQGNRFGLVLLDLPVGVSGPVERLHLTAQRMHALKQSREAQLILATLGAAAHMPVALEKGLVEYLSRRAVAVVSNLPGPTRPLSIAGARINNLVFWPPQAGGVGIGVSVFSYAGELSMGVSSDTALIANPQLLVDAFRREIKHMLRVPRGAEAASVEAE